MPWLEVLEGAPPQRVEIKRPEVTIGRSPDCDLVIDLDSISRVHARLVRDGQGWTIEDKSRNGTFVNGTRITARTRIRQGDRLSVAEVGVALRDQAPVAQPDDGRSTIFFKRKAADAAAPSSSVPTVVPAEVRLRAVLEISRNLGAELRLEDLLPKILESLFAIFPQADRGFIVLRDDVSGELVPKAMRSRQEGSAGGGLSHTIIRHAMDHGEAVLSADARSDSAFDATKSIVALDIRSVMCAPLVSRDGVAMGVIQLHTEAIRKPFAEADLELLVAMGQTAALALENARLHESVVAQERLKRDLELAREVQQGFLPAFPPSLPGYAFYACYKPAYGVGGDYYGFVPLSGGRMVVSLGDVSGKGMSAALLMARVSSEVRYAALSSANPAEAVTRVHRSLSDGMLSDRFVTLLYGELDPATHGLAFVNAGHMAPLVQRASGKFEEPGEDSADLPLNVSPDPAYEYSSLDLRLAPGDMVLLYTDGVTEAANAAGTLFGPERLKAVVRRAAPEPQAIAEAILREIETFVAGHPPADDVTMVCFRRLA